ncbi:MAG: phosphatase PAP2 family protein [Gammaproteobacteria bacterium]|nr:phosphatase PAP2 family protein [Gammaproteobacteria bacterium]
MSRYLWPALIVVIGLLVFGVIAAFVTPGPIGPDAPTLEAIEQARTEPWTQVMVAITSFGKGRVTAVIVLVLAIGIGMQHAGAEAAFLLIANLGSAVLSPGVKALFARPRPPPDVVTAITHPQSFSFPSGHALSAMVFYTSLVLVAVRLGYRKLAVALTVLAVIMVPTMGFTRVYLGVHYPSDAIAGFALGAAWVWLAYLGYLVIGRNTSGAISPAN